MKNLIITLIIAMFMTACELDYVPGMPVADYDIEIGNIYDYDFEGSEEIPEFETINEAAKWISNNFIYTSDDGDYWQTPEETFYRRNEDNKMMGDCEDSCILSMFIIKKQFNLNSYLVIDKEKSNTNPNWKYHSVIRIHNIYVDIIKNKIYNSLEEFLYIGIILPIEKEIIEEFTYGQTMWLVIAKHNSDI